MHIGIAGPIASADIVALLDPPNSVTESPRGYAGAPLLATLMEELLTRGHRVTAFTLSSDLPLDDGATVVATGPNLRVHFVPMRPKAWPFNGRRPGRIVDLYAFERRGLERAMRAAAPDVVHAHWAYEFAWAALKSGLPHVVTCHDAPALIARMSSGLKRGGYRWLRAGMARHVLRHAECVTAVSPYMQAEIQSWCKVPVAVVPNPVDRKAFAMRRRAEPGRARVCMVSNGWDERKNPQPALRAFDALSRSRPHAELVLCGHGFGPGDEAERWWRAEGLRGHIEFLGPTRHADVLELMSRSDVLLHSSLEESFGVVLVEAMAMGLPVVAGKASGAVPWVVGGGGQLVDVRQPGELSAALVAALDSGPAILASCRLALDEARRRFMAASVAGAYEGQYGAALSRRLNTAGVAS